ncbi:MAG: nucleoside-triphosphatase [Nitrospira sp.]
MTAGHAPHILITGLPGVGKTTLVCELAKRLVGYRPDGFYTEEIRNAQGTREGFRLVTLSGRQLILSHIRHAGPHRVGRYGVDVEKFEGLLKELDLKDSLAPLIIIDEIGRMECFSKRFIDVVTLLLDGPKVLVATIALKGEGFIQRVKQRPDCRLVTVTTENRDRLPDELASELQERLGVK